MLPTLSAVEELVQGVEEPAASDRGLAVVLSIERIGGSRIGPGVLGICDPARAGTRRFWRLSALRAITNAP